MHKSWLVLADKILTGRCIDDFTFNNILLFYHVKQRVSMLLWVCTVIDHRRCENVGRTSMTYLAVPWVPCFCSYHTLTSVIYYWTLLANMDLFVNKPLNSQIKFVILLTVNHTILIMLIQRILLVLDQLELSPNWYFS